MSIGSDPAFQSSDYKVTQVPINFYILNIYERYTSNLKSKESIVRKPACRR